MNKWATDPSIYADSSSRVQIVSARIFLRDTYNVLFDKTNLSIYFWICICIYSVLHKWVKYDPIKLCEHWCIFCRLSQHHKRSSVVCFKANIDTVLKCSFGLINILISYLIKEQLIESMPGGYKWLICGCLKDEVKSWLTWTGLRNVTKKSTTLLTSTWQSTVNL